MYDAYKKVLLQENSACAMAWQFSLILDNAFSLKKFIFIISGFIQGVINNKNNFLWNGNTFEKKYTKPTWLFPENP